MKQISRRTVLRGLGAAVSLPILEAMTPIRAAAAVFKPKPVRMACLFVPNGINMQHWTPAASGAEFELPSILSALNPVKSEISVISGLAQQNAFALGDGPGDHARSSAVWLTGVHPVKTSGTGIHGGTSADQIAAKHLASETKFASLELGCERGSLAGDCDSGYSCAYANAISWVGPETPNAKETNPRLVFERLFVSADEEANRQNLLQRKNYRLSILDFVMDQAADLSKQLSGQDQRKLDEYLSSIRDIEHRLVQFEKESLAAGNPGVAKPGGVPQDFGEHIKLMGDMMILAFQADLTRVCTFMFANEGSNRSYRQIGISEGHHEISHHGKDEAKLEMKRKIDAYHVQQLAAIIEKMKSIEEEEGTLLDNTMLVYGGGISDGDRHNHDDLPILFAGRGGGSIKQGRHLQLPNGTPMNNLLVSMLDKMGVKGETLGDANGNLNGIF